jgi:hypothetical protein
MQLVKRSAKEESHYPLMEEYDFKNDHRNPVLNMDLRPSTRIRVKIVFHCCLHVVLTSTSFLFSRTKRSRCPRCSATAAPGRGSSYCPAGRASR